MEYIQKLPFFMGCLAAMIVGTVSYFEGSDNQVIFLRMAVLMIIFFIIGIFIKNTLVSIQVELEEKEKEKLKEEKQRSMDERNKQNAAAEAPDRQQAQKSQNQVGRRIDLAAEDADDEFQPLSVSRVISSKLKE